MYRVQELEKFKVIGKDNYDRELVPDIVLLDSGTLEKCLEFKKDYLNQQTRGGCYFSDYYPFVVPIDEKLWEGMEEFR